MKKISFSRFSRLREDQDRARPARSPRSGSSAAAPAARRRNVPRYRSFSETFLMPTMRLSGSNSVMRSTSRNGIAVRQDALDRRVVERQRQVHGVIASIIRGPRMIRHSRAAGSSPLSESRLHIRRPPAGRRAIPKPSEREILTTLFDLGRQVTSVLDFDELLRADSPADRPADPVRRVRRLPARRAARRAAHGVRRRLSRTEPAIKLRPGAGLVGAAVSSEQPLLVSDVTTDPRYIESCPAWSRSWSCRCCTSRGRSAR